MPDPSASWIAPWLATKLRTHDSVRECNPIAAQRVQVVRNTLSEILIGTLASTRVNATVLRPVLDVTPTVSFVVNVPRESYTTGSALDLAAEKGVPLGSMKDLYRALSLADIHSYQNSEVLFIERGLLQHSRVESIRRIDDWRYTLSRSGLSEVTAVFLHDYELTADAVRVARDRYQEFDDVVIANPNGRPTSEALATASSIGCRILKWRPFLSRLARQ